MEKKELLLGAHMSIAGGFDQALIRGNSIGCTAIQIFTKSSRQWATKPITLEQAKLFKTTFSTLASIKIVIAHASYLINIGSANEELAHKSMQALIDELERCQILEIPFLVLHPGSFSQSTLQQSLNVISKRLDSVFEKAESTTVLLLENMAGQGSTIGSRFEELEIIYKNSNHKNRLGFCIDTCHAFAAGYNFTNPSLYQHFWQEFDNILGIQNLKAIHINDSAKDLGSHVDRHTHIGKGKIGIEAFKLLMNDAKLSLVPKILETPKMEDLAFDLENLTLLKSLIT